MLINSKLVKYNTPDSEFDSFAESYEYFLMWQSPDTGVMWWLFTDFIERERGRGDVINKDSQNINKIFDSAEQRVIVVAEDITSNQYSALRDIIRAKEIRRYFKDGTFERLAINTDSTVKRISDQRYNFEIELYRENKKVLR